MFIRCRLIRSLRIIIPLVGLYVGGVRALATAQPELWDTMSDTWVATDSLGRTLPTRETAGPPRPDRTVAMFYFLWLGAHVNGGPYDITKILRRNPNAMNEPANPLWGPVHAPHHWGEPLFGYYLTEDPYVLRRHAQMLADAGVDVIIFDVTNQVTYRKNYQALLKVFAEIRAAGGRTPQIAFLCPFWDPGKVVNELYAELYQPGLHPELWFRWEGKPLILADPDLLRPMFGLKSHHHPVEILPGRSLGQTFQATNFFDRVAGNFPNWGDRHSAVTLTLRKNGPTGEVARSERFTNVQDNAWLTMQFDQPQPPGVYYLGAADASGRIGWWSTTNDAYAAGQAYVDDQPVDGDRSLQTAPVTANLTVIQQFFTFRKPQPDYFQGPTGTNQWSWLEITRNMSLPMRPVKRNKCPWAWRKMR